MRVPSGRAWFVSTATLFATVGCGNDGALETGEPATTEAVTPTTTTETASQDPCGVPNPPLPDPDRLVTSYEIDQDVYGQMTVYAFGDDSGISVQGQLDDGRTTNQLFLPELPPESLADVEINISEDVNDDGRSDLLVFNTVGAQALSVVFDGCDLVRDG